MRAKVKLYELHEEMRLIEQMLDQEDVDQESFSAALDRLNTEFESKVSNIGLLVKQLKADIEARKEVVKDLQARNRASENRIDWLRNYLSQHLEKTVKTPLVTVSRQKGREKVVIDGDLPDDLMIYREPEPNKAAVKQAIEDGREVLAHIERGDDVVVIR